ncbi:MAG: gamma-glutamylcyclotransferase [Rhodospirillaceae bacterium]|nr:gamma-glutamylcyclotransferase [Rhodospirillaceae bacterium]MBL6942715.1 gamma-glutamylcyclotransferase [Rhodospirillales bacterium]
MMDRQIDGFFYGLFMDSDVLLENKVEARNPRRAYVEDYELRIGRRATLIPAPGVRAYGMVFALTHDEFERLYSGPGLEQYRAEAVIAHSLEGNIIPALCFNLREAPGPNETNTEYAARLRKALSKLDFPAKYVTSVT